MLFNFIIASTVLAYVAVAAPIIPELVPITTIALVLLVSTGPSLTQQLFLANITADRFILLPKDKQFKFAFNNPALKDKGGEGGDLIAANRKTFPALVGTGSGIAIGFLKGYGFNTPHIEMVSENNVFNKPSDLTSGRRVIRNIISQFEMQLFYQGSVHTQFNPSCYLAVFVASFNSEDFGTGQVPNELFAMSPNVITAAFGEAINSANVDNFKATIPTSIAKGIEQCLTKCGIKKRSTFTLT
ncbi:hypothetical protein BKA61DRAFT_723553 [Leptodontidium sp. MPI-SDFR-AT-0119]|nr:hypothetical protein BKA61DRAFT_723553 [Leptodontidium sp. MPI-SDFR-AT-0119]